MRDKGSMGTDQLVGVCLVYLRSSQEASVSAAEELRAQVLGDEVREVAAPRLVKDSIFYWEH